METIVFLIFYDNKNYEIRTPDILGVEEKQNNYFSGEKQKKIKKVMKM